MLVPSDYLRRRADAIVFVPSDYLRLSDAIVTLTEQIRAQGIPSLLACEKAICDLGGAMADGKLPSSLVNEITGRIESCPPERWRTHMADRVMRRTGYFLTGISEPVRLHVIIRDVDFSDWLAAAAGDGGRQAGGGVSAPERMQMPPAPDRKAAEVEVAVSSLSELKSGAEPDVASALTQEGSLGENAQAAPSPARNAAEIPSPIEPAAAQLPTRGIDPPKRNVPRKDYRHTDAPLVAEMRAMIADGGASNPTNAARAVVKRAVSRATDASKVMRLVRHYRDIYPEG